MRDHRKARRWGLTAMLVCALVLVAYFQRDRIGLDSVVPTPVSAQNSSAEAAALDLPTVTSSTTRVQEPALATDAPLPEQPTEESSPARARTHGSLKGIVADDVGAVLPEAWVWSLLENGQRLRTQANAEGQYELDGIEFGTRRIVASAKNYHDQELVLLLDAKAPDQEHDFHLRKKQRIRVRLVTSAGEPTIEALSRAKIPTMSWKLVPVATREDPGAIFKGVTGSLNNPFGIGSFWQAGFFGLEPLTPDEYGTITLNVDGPAWLSLVAAHQVMCKLQVDPLTEVVIFEVDVDDFLALRASVRGRLLDGESGVALAGSVELSDNPFSMARLTPVDSNGEFLIEDAQPGSRYLVVRAPERAELVLPIQLSAGAVLDVGDLTLHVPVRLQGRTVDQAGHAIKAVLRWGRLDPESGKVDWVRRRSSRSNEQGEFRLEGLAAGLWVVQAPGLPAAGPRPYDAKLASLPVRVDARDGGVENIELVLRPTGSLVLVSTDQEEPWPYARAYDKRGLPAAAAWIGRWSAETPLFLPPGTYELVITRDGRELERHTVVVDESPQRLTFDFEPIPD